MYNVIVLNNIKGGCLIATSKYISLECVVSDCVYVFRKYPRWLPDDLYTTICQHFKCIIIKICFFLDVKMTYLYSCF